MANSTRSHHPLKRFFPCVAVIPFVAAGCLVEQHSAALKERPRPEPDSPVTELERKPGADGTSDSRLSRREPDEEAKGGECTDGAAAIEFRRQMRLDSNGRIEPGALLRAKE